MNFADEVFRTKNIKKAFLKTTLNNFYEKFGWTFFETQTIDGRLEKLYFKEFQTKNKSEQSLFLVFCLTKTKTLCYTIGENLKKWRKAYENN